MSRRKTERLLNLVVCLLATRRYLTAEQIRLAVPGYPDGSEAFKRMFERDKEELRELAIPLETGSEDDGEVGYRIQRQAYELPEIHLSPDEAAIVGLAARVWRRASMADAASGALLKLRAAGVDTDEPSALGIEPRVDTTEPAFPALWRAVRDRRAVAFDYQAVGRSRPQRRHLEPWGVVSRGGRWYVAGFDADRDAPRVFRLSRVLGEVEFDGPAGGVKVPADVNLRQLVVSADGPAPERREATVRLRAGAAHGARRWARNVRPDDAGSGVAGRSHGGETGVAGPSQGGEWELAELDFAGVERFADFLAGFADTVQVIGPPDLRDAVIQQLKAVLS